MHINDWIEIDKDLKWYIDEKQRVIEEQGPNVIDSLPENDEACGELLEILVDYLPKRYPTLFERIECPGGGIWNKVTDERILGIQGRKGIDALRACSKLVEDDFLMGREREDGHVYFTGGLVVFPGESFARLASTLKNIFLNALAPQDSISFPRRSTSRSRLSTNLYPSSTKSCF